MSLAFITVPEYMSKEETNRIFNKYSIDIRMIGSFGPIVIEDGRRFCRPYKQYEVRHRFNSTWHKRLERR